LSSAAKRWADRQVIASATMKQVLAELAYMHKSGSVLFPSQAYLAEKTVLTVRAIREALRLLGHFQIVRRTARSNGRTGRSSDRFELAFERDFIVTSEMAAAARKALRGSTSKRNHVPVGEDLQEEPRSGPPRNHVPMNRRPTSAAQARSLMATS
jgi:hypothetical protein